MTTIAEFNSKECPRWDASDVDACFDLSLDASDPTKLILDNSWGATSVDLTPAIKAGETVTHLMLDPESPPEYLRFDNEAGDSECIHGDGLSRIISMRYLKDVSQESIWGGIVYMLNGDDDIFYPHDLAAFERETRDRLTALEGRVSTLEQTVRGLQTTVNSLVTQMQTVVSKLNNHETRLGTIETTLAKPNGIPANTRLVWGNIDIFSDYTNSDNRNWGLYTHNINNLIANDEFMA